MSRYLPLVALLVVLGIVLLDCQRGRESVDGTSTPAEILAASELKHRQVVSLTGTGSPPTCPTVGGWTLTRLFEDSGATTNTAWCLYETTDTSPGWWAMRTLERALDATGYDKEGPAPDRATVSVAGNLDYESEMRALLKRRFVERRGTLDFEGPVTRPAVRLTIIDDRKDATGGNVFEQTDPDVHTSHGLALANLARQILCVGPDQTCPVEIRTRQALKLPFDTLAGVPVVSIPSKRDARTQKISPTGTMVGTMLDLATAIDDEVADWQRDAPDTRLILNLSLGWNAGLVPDGDNAGLVPDGDNAGLVPDGDMDLLTIAVRDALVRARCHGAIVVAAAGNRDGGGGKQLHHGMLLPAAWSDELVEPECVGAIGRRFDPRARSDEQTLPLVNAVGSVSNAGPALGSVRPQGLPAMVASGDHAVTALPDGTLLDPMTGSSVSSLVAAAAAAAIWHNAPALSSKEVEHALLEGASTEGDQAPTAPDLDGAIRPSRSIHGGLLSKIRLIDACSGIADDPDDSEAEAGRYICAARPSWSGSATLAGADIPGSLEAFTSVQDASYTELSTSPTECEGATILCPDGGPTGVGLTKCDQQGVKDANGLASACTGNLRMGPSVAPFLWPQPDWPDCDYCFLSLPRDSNLITAVLLSSLIQGAQLAQLEVDRVGTPKNTTEIYTLPKGDGSSKSTLYISYRLTSTSALTEAGGLVGGRLVLVNSKGGVRVIPLSVSNL